MKKIANRTINDEIKYSGHLKICDEIHITDENNGC